jgi:hypothetical protein
MYSKGESIKMDKGKVINNKQVLTTTSLTKRV